MCMSAAAPSLIDKSQSRPSVFVVCLAEQRNTQPDTSPVLSESETLVMLMFVIKHVCDLPVGNNKSLYCFMSSELEVSSEFPVNILKQESTVQ